MRSSVALVRRFSVAFVAGVMALATLALFSARPAAAQLPELPGGDTIIPLDELPVPIDLDDPLLDPVEGVITTLMSLIDDLLAMTPLPNLLSLTGEDAIDAAIAFSQATYESSDTAVIARDDLFADALTTGALQGIFDSPLLLTTSGDLDPRTAEELIRLGVTRLVVVGGDKAINELVLQKLDIAGIDVTRLGGPSRVETAVAAAGNAAPGATTAVLTRAYSAVGADDSQAYADLLAVSPWAATNDWPVLLTQSEVLTGSVRQYLESAAVTDVVIIGGEGAISPAVEAALNEMGITTRRVGGANRFATAIAIANERGFADSGDVDRLIVAEGGASRSDVWAPGFAAAAHGAKYDAPVLLTDGASIPTETLDFVTAGLADNVLDGGPAAICASFVNPVACEALGLLLLGHLTDAVELLNILLTDLPNLGDLIAVIEDLLGVDIADVPVVGETIEDVVDQVDDVVDGVEDTVDDVVDDILGGTVPEVPTVPGLPGL